MPTTQEGRLLHLTTPLGEDFLLIKRFRANESLNKLFEIQLEILHEENESGDEPTVVDASQLLGQMMTILVQQNDGTQRHFNGICVQFQQGNRNARFTKYQAVLVPHVWLLTQNNQSKIFQNKSVPDILREILAGFEVDYEIQGTFEKRNYCVQYRESDFDFISRLMEEEGIFYYFAHSDGNHRMIIGNTPQSHRECPSKPQIPFVLDISDLPEWEGSIATWSVSHQLRTGKVTLWDHNFQLPTSHLDAEQLSRFNIGGNQELEFYDFPGDYGKRFDGINQAGDEQPAELQKVFQDRQRVAEIRQQEIDVSYKSAKGTGDCCALTAGYRFSLQNHPTAENNGAYILTRVQHEAVQSPQYISGEEVLNPYIISFSTIPHGSGHAPFRPLRQTLKPTIYGTQTATVVGPSREEIFTDKYGRVKVQFHWDRDGKNDPNSSCWLRVGTSIAGNKWGTMFIPRVGQEVVVDFMEGDPDQPIIVGSVYNPNTMPHYELPKYKTLSYIKTRTSQDDGKGFNELRFEDKQGKEQVFVHSQKRMDIRVRGSYYETCGGNRQERIGVRSDNQPGGNLAVTVGGSYDLHVKDSMYIGIDGKLNEAVKGEVVEDYQSSLSTLVKTKAELNALEITLEAKTKISLKVGGNCIMIDPSGITIAGTMVKINSGGFASGTGNPSIDDPLDAESADTGQPGYLDRPRTGGGRRGRNRRRLNSQHYIAPPRPGEDPRITAMRGTLANSEQGRHALEVYDRYGVTSSFVGGQGSTYDPSTNNMNLNPTQTPDRQALGFVHEMNHAEADREHRTGDIENQNRNDYVNTMVNEETEGVIRSIEARDELIDAGHSSASATNYPLQNEYHAAYNQAVTDARAANPNLTDAEAAEIGRAAGRQRVHDGFTNGEVTTSNTNDPYPDYYGNAWDAHHPTP